MNFLSVIIVVMIAIWFITAVIYIIKNKGGCTCGSCKKHCESGGVKKESCAHGCTGCDECRSCSSIKK